MKISGTAQVTWECKTYGKLSLTSVISFSFGYSDMSINKH